MYFPKSGCCPDLTSLSNATRGDKFWKFLIAVVRYLEGSLNEHRHWSMKAQGKNREPSAPQMLPLFWALNASNQTPSWAGEGVKHPLPTPCSLQPSQTQLRMVSANWGSDDNLRSRSWFWKTLLTVAYE